MDLNCWMEQPILVEAIQMENRKVVMLIAQDLIGQPPWKRIRRQYVSLQTRFLALSGSRRWTQDNRGVPDRHRTQHSLDAQ